MLAHFNVAQITLLHDVSKNILSFTLHRLNSGKVISILSENFNHCFEVYLYYNKNFLNQCGDRSSKLLC